MSLIYQYFPDWSKGKMASASLSLDTKIVASTHPLIIGRSKSDIIIHHKQSHLYIHLNSKLLPKQLTQEYLNGRIFESDLPIEAFLCFFERFTFNPGRVIRKPMGQLEWYWCMLVADLLELPQDAPPFEYHFLDQAKSVLPFSRTRNVVRATDFGKTFDMIVNVRKCHTASVVQFILLDLCDFSAKCDEKGSPYECKKRQFDQIAEWYGLAFFSQCLLAASQTVSAVESGFVFKPNLQRCSRPKSEYVKLWTRSDALRIVHANCLSSSLPEELSRVRESANLEIIFPGSSFSIKVHDWILHDHFEPYRLLVQNGDPQVKDGKWSIELTCPRIFKSDILMTMLIVVDFIYSGDAHYEFKQDKKCRASFPKSLVCLGFASCDSNGEIKPCEDLTRLWKKMKGYKYQKQ